MNITIATGPMLPVPPLLGGAIPRMWQGLAEEFARRGHSVCIFARSFPGQPGEEMRHGVRYLRRGGYSQGLSVKLDLAKDFFYAAGAVWKLPTGDILVMNDFWLPVFAARFRRDAGKVVINANRFPKGQFRLYQSAARIAAASVAVRNAIVRECPPLAARTRVLPNPIDISVMTPAKDRRRTANGKKVLLFVGRLHPEKGVHVLIEALSQVRQRHPDWRLRLVGPVEKKSGGGGAGYQRRLEKLAAGLPVEFVGQVFDAGKLAEIYRDADLFCYPSLAEKGESFGVAPLESMACGVPPVVSDLECFRDYLTDGETGWVFNHRAENPAKSLSDKLTEIMITPGLIAAAGQKTVKIAGRFSYAAVAEQYLADFGSLLKGAS